MLDMDFSMECTACFSTCVPNPSGLCPGCRGVAGGKRESEASPARTRERKPFVMTRDREDQLRQAYKRARTKPELSQEITRLASSWGVPRSTITNQALKLGISLLSWKEWTVEENAYLEEHAGEMSIKRIAKTLKRSPDSVKHQIHRLQLSGEVTKGYSMRQLQELLGVKHTRVQMWLSKGWLRMEHERVTESSIQKFLFQRMDEYSFRNCDEPWLKGMLNPNFGLRSNVRDDQVREQDNLLDEEGDVA
jgi:hypothetical protein